MESDNSKEVSESMKEWINEYFKEQWIESDTDIDFSKYETIDISSSLHIFEEKYLIDGNTYRLLYPISDSEAKPTIEILK